MNESPAPNFTELQRAEAVTPDPINPKIRTVEVIDTDFHLTPKWETIRSYLKEPFKSRIFHFPLGSRRRLRSPEASLRSTSAMSPDELMKKSSRRSMKSGSHQ